MTGTQNLPQVVMSDVDRIRAVKDNYQYHVRDFVTWLDGRPFNEATITEYFAYLNTTDYSANTIRLKRQGVKKRVQQLMQHLDHNEYARVKTFLDRLDENHETSAPKINSVAIGADKVLSTSEYLQLKHAATERQAAFIMLLWATGCRVSEVCGIKLGHCVRTEKHVRLRVMGKGRKQRDVRIPVDLYEKILAVFRGELYLLETQNGKAYNRSYISSEIAKLGQRVLHRRISAHTLRHSFATRKILNHPGHIQAISQYLGHSDVSITLSMYCHAEISDEQLFDDLMLEDTI